MVLMKASSLEFFRLYDFMVNGFCLLVETLLLEFAGFFLFIDIHLLARPGTVLNSVTRCISYTITCDWLIAF